MPSKNVKRRKKTSRIYDVFVGCQVSVVLKDLSNNNNNLTVTGILLDECEEWLYLGSTEEIHAAVKKDNIGAVLVDGSDTEIPRGTITQ